MTRSPVTTTTTTTTRPRTLKRTISKCGLDASQYPETADDGHPRSASPLPRTAAKKLVPGGAPALHPPPPVSKPPRPTAVVLPMPAAASHVYYDDNEPVLLPRQDRLVVGLEDADELLESFDGAILLHPAHVTHRIDNDGGEDAEMQSVTSAAAAVTTTTTTQGAEFGWDGSPQAMKDRYYETILESTTALVSPSPQHILYPYTPGGGTGSASTVSVDSMPSPHPPYHYVAAPSVASAHRQQHLEDDDEVAYRRRHRERQERQLTEDRDSLTAASLHAIVLEYLHEVCVYYHHAQTFTFGQVGRMVQSVPWAFRYIQGIVKNRLQIAWHLVGSFVENVLDFICDEDIREATIAEFGGFLRSLQATVHARALGGGGSMGGHNIFANLSEFFHDVLGRFKKYLVALWLATRRIEHPCEFGKKSSTLFLCMECHREHC